ncbi:MAG TPA: anti-sigma regulatory factor [Gemmatimonadales bacterium]|nr:anti-sigma regulatory factor [Gemmatimonadales bacterium]
MIERDEHLEVRTSTDVARVRQVVRAWSVEVGFSLVDQTKMVTAASELARNTLEHGGGGIAHILIVSANGRRGVRLVCKDEGPGIADIDTALRDGYSTGTGLGLGLGGARRLVNEFSIESQKGAGTTVTITRWK